MSMCVVTFVKHTAAAVGQMYPQNPNYFMPGGAQRFYPPTGMPPVRPNPRWAQPQMRAAGQQQGDAVSLLQHASVLFNHF